MKSSFIRVNGMEDIPGGIGKDMKFLTDEVRSVVTKYIKDSKLDANSMAAVVVNALMQNMVAIVCTMFYSDNDNIVHVSQEVENICQAIKQQCLMSYKNRIEKDLRGEKDEEHNEEHKDSDK